MLIHLADELDTDHDLWDDVEQEEEEFDEEVDEENEGKKKKKKGKASATTSKAKKQKSADEETPIPAADISNVTIVNTPAAAAHVLSILNSPSVRTRYHACDTEVMNIDVKKQSPIGHGTVTCLSIYVGDDVNFGNGPRLWIDTLDAEGGGEQMLQLFKPYLEDASILKVWHNYSFDRHVLYNHGIHVKGFGGDTMHMARLADSARISYSLESLSTDLLGRSKIPMKKLFAQPVLKKNGEPGLLKKLPPVEQIQRDPAARDHWIDYSTYDAEATFGVRESLYKTLQSTDWIVNPNDTTKSTTMWQFYEKYWRPFGEMLCDMEEIGIYVRAKNYLSNIQKLAEADQQRAVDTFRAWAIKQCPAAVDMNIASAVQKQHFFFASPTSERVFSCDNAEGIIEEGKKKAKKKRDFVLRGLGMPVEGVTAKKAPAVSLPILRKLAGNLDKSPPKYGIAYKFFGEGETGAEACEAINALCKIAAGNIMLNTFIIVSLTEGS